MRDDLSTREVGTEQWAQHTSGTDGDGGYQREAGQEETDEMEKMFGERSSASEIQS